MEWFRWVNLVMQAIYLPQGPLGGHAVRLSAIPLPDGDGTLLVTAVGMNDIVREQALLEQEIAERNARVAQREERRRNNRPCG